MMQDEIGKIKKRILDAGLDTDFILDTRDGVKYTYQRFFGDVLATAERIQAVNMPERIFVIMQNGYYPLVIYFACLLAGRTVSPIDPAKNPDEMTAMISSSGGGAVVAEESAEKVLPADIVTHMAADIYGSGDDDNADGPFFEKLEAVDFDRPYLITYTSGTSGQAKGVIHCARSLFLSALGFADLLGNNKNNCFLHVMPMYYMAGILNTFILPFVSGAKIVLADRFSAMSAGNFWTTVSKTDADTFWLSPSMLAMIEKMDRSQAGKAICASRRTRWYIGTAPLSEQLRLEFEEIYGVQLYQSYGLSETLFVSCVTQDSYDLRQPCVGRLLKGVSLTSRADGELLIDVPWMFLGYTNEDTKQYFDHGRYISGDLGDIEDRVLRITDRKKDLIIRGGVNISPLAIETQIRSNPGVVDVAVTAGNDALMGEIVLCAVVKAAKTSADDIKRNALMGVRKLGAGYAVDKMIFVEDIPQNSNGKTDRKALRELF